MNFPQRMGETQREKQGETNQWVSRNLAKRGSKERVVRGSQPKERYGKMKTEHLLTELVLGKSLEALGELC